MTKESIKEFINARIKEITSRFPGTETAVLTSERYYITYFSDIELNETSEIEIKLEERFIIALQSAVSYYKNWGIFWLIFFPFIYFFGSIFRDFFIDISGGGEESIDFYFAYFIWIGLCVLMPLIAGISFLTSSGKIQNYLKINEIGNLSKGNTNTFKDKSIISSKKDRLNELEDLYINELITEEEYKNKRNRIIDDL
jgi:hypothetical protein